MNCVSQLVNIILFPDSRYLFILIENIVKMLFGLGFRLTLMRGQKLFSDLNLYYHNVNKKFEIVYNIIVIKTIVIIYS